MVDGGPPSADEPGRCGLIDKLVALTVDYMNQRKQCIQLHGGIGVTDEYIGSHYFKRLTMLEMAYGDTLHHLDEVSNRMRDTAGVFA